MTLDYESGILNRLDLDFSNIFDLLTNNSVVPFRDDPRVVLGILLDYEEHFDSLTARVKSFPRVLQQLSNLRGDLRGAIERFVEITQANAKAQADAAESEAKAQAEYRKLRDRMFGIVDRSKTEAYSKANEMQRLVSFYNCPVLLADIVTNLKQ